MSPGAPEPIYRQLVEQVTRLVASGTLQAEQAMPSVRELASALAVNPMTISKAYSLLESSGVLVRQRGLGMSVAQQSKQVKKTSHRLEMILPTLEKLVFEAHQLELDADTVIKQLTSLFKGAK